MRMMNCLVWTMVATAALARPMRSVTSALAPSKRSVTAVSRCATPPRLCADALCAEAFADEMRRRGLQTALEQLEEDGPSAFKDPTKVVEYVMLNLQHKAQGSGLAEAFRFSCREPGKSSFVSGNALSTRRISWKTAKVVSGYASGPARSLADFEAEIREHYGLLLGCAQWRFAVHHPVTQEPLARSSNDDGRAGDLREYVLLVDETPVSVRLLYDWGAWCYLICSVEVLDSNAAALGIGSPPDPRDEVGGRSL